MAVVGEPSYFDSHPRPRTPHDLARHGCINLRLRTLGGVYAWEFEKGGRELKVRVEGQVAFNDERLILQAARAGLRPAYVFGDSVAADVANGSLIAELSGLDAAVRRLSSLLFEPPPAIASFRNTARSAPISWVANVCFPPITDIAA